MDVHVNDYYATSLGDSIPCDTCNRELKRLEPATGECYSMGVFLGVYCDTHGRRMMDSGEADAAYPIDD